MIKTSQESLANIVFCLLISCILCCLLTTFNIAQPAPIELKGLQGTWEEIKEGGNITITITGNSFHFYRDTSFWFETTITLPAGTDPPQLHATILRCPPSQKNSLGKVVPAIFRIEEEILTLAAFSDHEAAPPKSFEDKEAMRYELRKVQPQEKNTDGSTSQ